MKTSTVLAADFARTKDGWRSNGGAGRAHPDRARPFSLSVDVPVAAGRLESVAIVGVLAVHATPDVEPSGVVGARALFYSDGRQVHSQDLVQGLHYGDASSSADVYRLNGDETSLETVGRRVLDGCQYRVDKLSLGVPSGVTADRMVLQDLGTPASFVVFDVLFEFEDAGVCPFRGRDGNVALGDIGAVLRLRDSASFDRAIKQFQSGIMSCGRDMDEARGLALTFIGSVVGALLELDAQRSLHKELLEAARELEALREPGDVAAAAVRRILRLTARQMPQAGHGDVSVKRALEILSRSFAGGVDADAIAQELNLSTSHFRHLFREATRLPFQKYLVALRLEKARELLLQTQMPVTDVAGTVGFQSTAHFSRAFSKRFGASPSALRQSRR